MAPTICFIRSFRLMMATISVNAQLLHLRNGVLHLPSRRPLLTFLSVLSSSRYAKKIVWVHSVDSQPLWWDQDMLTVGILDPTKRVGTVYSMNFVVYHIPLRHADKV